MAYRNITGKDWDKIDNKKVVPPFNFLNEEDIQNVDNDFLNDNNSNSNSNFEGFTFQINE